MSILSPLQEIHARLTHHLQPGGTLYGLKYDDERRVSVEGAGDFPLFQPMLSMDVEESIWAGAGRIGSGNNPNIKLEITVPYRLCVDMRYGPHAEKGPLWWYGRICDAIETGVDGTVDATLKHTCDHPVKTSMRQAEFAGNQLCYHVVVDVVIVPKPMCRGGRSEE